MSKDAGPEQRMIAIADLPGAVESAKIVELLFLEVRRLLLHIVRGGSKRDVSRRRRLGEALIEHGGVTGSFCLLEPPSTLVH